jgi:tRNA threonylcarbamoyladenosine biosynthesis protein TsaB
LAANQLSAIALLTGPGSFTGLRVGVATAKALAYAIRIPILEVDTLDVIASQVSPGHSALHVVLDAYRGQVFHSKYISSQPDIIDHEKYKKVSETSIVDIDALLKRVLEELPLSGSCVLCGPGCDRIRKYLADPENGTSQLTKSQLERVQWLDGPETVPQADTVAKLGYRKLLAGQVLDAFHVNPRYYRGSAAEEKIANSKRS